MVEFDNNRKVYQAIAMEDLKENSIALNVFPVEALPGMVGGGFKAASTTASFSTIDEDGNTLHHSITTSNHITAEWSSFNGESKPNNVKKGQQVVLTGRDVFSRWDFTPRSSASITNTGPRVIPPPTQGHTLWHRRSGRDTRPGTTGPIRCHSCRELPGTQSDSMATAQVPAQR